MQSENHNDEILSSVGPNGRNVAAGKGIEQQNNSTTINVDDAILLHIMDMKMEIGAIKQDIGDVRQDIGDAHTERVSLIVMFNDLLKSQHPRWLQILMVSLAAAMLLMAMLIWVKAAGLDGVNWLAVFFCLYIVASICVDVVAWVLFSRYRREQEERMHTVVTDLLKRIEDAKYKGAL